MALTLETMWSLRNEVVHNDGQMSLLVELHSLEKMCKEHILAAQTSVQLSPRQAVTCWKAPPNGVIKLSVDAMCSNEKGGS
nr:hypothetical protein CFP56_14423 [Quercus suber]